MATYFILGKFTAQGVGTIKQGTKRLASARQLAKGFGVAIKEFHLTMGPYDTVMKVDAPDDSALARFVLSLGGRGNISTTTMRAFDEKEYKALASDLP